MEKVTCFKAKDGTVFEKEEDAARHELRLDFRAWYEANKIYGRCEGSQIEAKEMESWIIEHAARLHNFLHAARLHNFLDAYCD